MTKPSFVNEDDPLAESKGINISPVHFRSSPDFKQSPPHCIAVLPLTSHLNSGTTKTDVSSRKIPELTTEQLKAIRWNLYSHLAPFPYQDVELADVDKAIKSNPFAKNDARMLGEILACDALLTGEITNYGTEFLGLYSQNSVGAKLKLIRARDHKILWEGRHVATSHAGSFPITPVDVAVGVYYASSNIGKEQIVRVTDDLFRRLLSTWEVKESGTHKTLIVKQAPKPYRVTSKKLVLRSGPGKRYSAKSMLYRDELVSMLSRKNTPWVMVKSSDGRSGYVYGKYISEIKPVGLTQK